jgi:hypothetical protein
MDAWNCFMRPMVVTMAHSGLMTVPVGLTFFLQSFVTYWGASMARATLFTVPIAVVPSLPPTLLGRINRPDRSKRMNYLEVSPCLE